MNNVHLQDQIFRGMGCAARAIGVLCNAYRPTLPVDPLAPQNRFLQLSAAFSAQDYAFRRAGLPGQAAWYCICDTAYLSAGDYLAEVETDRVWFIGELQPLLPVVCVLTNRTVSISRPASYNVAGLSSYGGGTAPTPVVSAYPVSLLHGGELRGPSMLPSEPRLSGAIMLFPPTANVTLYRGDMITDDLGRSFIVGQAEENSLGWRLELKQGAV